VTTEPIAIASPTVRIREGVRAVATPVICVAAALLTTGLLLALLGADPIFAFKTLLLGGLGSPQALSDTLAKMIPIALIAFGVMLTFRCGLWNVGGEGQFYSGAIAAAITGISVDAPAALLIPLEMLAGIAAGCLTAYVPAVLKARLHANEILVTLMLNYVPVYLALYVIQGPFSHGLAAKTLDIHAAGELPWLIVGGLRLHAGLILVLVSVVAVGVLVERTTFGYRIRAVGSNVQAARAAGIDPVRTQFVAFLIAGGFGGLAGMIQVAAVHHNLLEGMSAGFGFTAIVAALLGRLQAVGTLIASFGFAALVVGGDSMQRVAKIESSTVFVIEGLILLFLLAGRVIGREQMQIG
jgi:general nucleoside transport system permease protein